MYPIRLTSLFALALAFIAPTTLPAAPAPATHATHAMLQDQLEALARRAQPGVLGIVVLDPQSGERWQVNAGRAYPMMSVFKAPVAAAVFARIDSGALSMEQTVTLTRADIVAGSAVPSIGAHFRGERMNFTVRQLLAAAVSDSDNTAVDALLKLVPPQDVTAFLRTKLRKQRRRACSVAIAPIWPTRATAARREPLRTFCANCSAAPCFRRRRRTPCSH